MTYRELLKELQGLRDRGQLKMQTVELVAQGQKFFPQRVFCRDGQGLAEIDRRRYCRMEGLEFLKKLEAMAEMVSLDSPLQAHSTEEDKKVGAVESLYLGEFFVELIVA